MANPLLMRAGLRNGLLFIWESGMWGFKGANYGAALERQLFLGEHGTDRCCCFHGWSANPHMDFSSSNFSAVRNGVGLFNAIPENLVERLKLGRAQRMPFHITAVTSSGWKSRLSSPHIQRDHCPSAYLPALPAFTFYLKTDTKLICSGLFLAVPGHELFFRGLFRRG